MRYKSISYPRISEWEYFISNNSKCDLLFITIMYFCELWRFAITFYIWKYTLPFDILSLISIWTHKTQLLVCIFILFNFVSTILDPNRAGMQIKHTGNTSYYKDCCWLYCGVRLGTKYISFDGNSKMKDTYNFVASSC